MTMKINELRFYYGNTNRVGVNYFDSEGTIKAGIDTTEKIINIFENMGFLTKDIHLAGGVNELSHTGDLAYGAVYSDVKAFLDNAYSDYIADREKAEEENKGWLSSYNFEYFFVLFRKNECDVRFFVRAGKDITIKYDDCIEIGTDMNQIVTDIKQNVYQNNCLVEGLDKIEDMLSEINIANILDKKQLFLVAISGMPLLMAEEIVLLYSDRKKADIAINRFRQTFNENKIKVLSVENNQVLFAKMTACGLRKFLLDGEGKILDFTRFCSVDSVKKVKNPEKMYEEMKNAQPSRRVTSNQTGITSAKISVALKMLPQIHKNRLITAYVCGLFLVLGSIVMARFIDTSYWWIAFLFFAMIIAFFNGLSDALKVSNKLKEKNPKIAKLAKLSLLLYLVPIVIIIVAINS